MIIHEISKNWYMILCSVDAIVLAEMVITAIAGVTPTHPTPYVFRTKRQGTLAKRLGGFELGKLYRGHRGQSEP